MTDPAGAPATRTATPHLAARPPRTWAGERLALPVLLTGVALIVLDFFIVNVALPAVQADLGASAAALEWVVAGYGLTFAVFLITAGRLGDRVGRRRVFVAGVAVFTVASAACGLAPDAETLVAARLLQGVGGAMISPTVLALIGVMFTGAERAKAIGTYATVMGVAAASGQLVGGLLLHADIAGLGWRLVFLVNVPVGMLALLGSRSIPESRADVPAKIDLVSLELLTLALIAVVLPLVDGRSSGWPWWTFVSFAAAPVLFAMLVERQRRVVRRGGVPLLDPRLLRHRTVSAGLLTQLTFWSGQASYFLVLALYLQLGRGLSALESGLVFTFVATTYVVTSTQAPKLVAKHGRTVIVVGALALALGHGLALAATLDVGIDGSVFLLAPGMMLAGAGMGLCLAPITATVLSTIGPQHAGAMSGVLSTVQQVGNALGVAVIGIVFFGQRHTGYAPAFEWSLGVLVVLLVGVAACARLLPAPSR